MIRVAMAVFRKRMEMIMGAIIFRVYDKKQERYLDPNLVSISGNGVLYAADADNKDHTIIQPLNDLSPRFIVEQSNQIATLSRL